MQMKTVVPAASARRIVAAVLLLITVVTVAQYRGIFNITFMSDDTMDFIQGTKIVKQEIWYPFVGKGMWRDGPQYYRPLPVISHGLDAVIFGYRPAAHRAMQLLLHLACCFAAYALYRSWLGKEREGAAALAALVFALHPIHEHPMWWPGGSRNDVMCGTFFVLAVLFFTEYARHRQTKSMVLTVLFATLAFMCKEMAYSLPLVCFVVYFLFAQEKSPLKARLNAAKAVVPLIAVATVFMVYRLIRFDLGSTLLGVQFGPEHLKASLHAAARGLLFPYDFSLRAFFQMNPVVVIVIVAVLVALASTRIQKLRSPIVLAGLAWIALSLLPVLRTMSPWGLYIPSVGFCLIVGYVFVPDRTRSGIAATLLVVALLASYLVQWEHRRTVWREMDRAADHTMNTLREDYAQKPFDRAIFLDVPGSIGAVSLYMHYFSLRLPLEMPDGAPKAIVLSIVILPSGQERQQVTVEKLSPTEWRLTAESDEARFVFPEHPAALYKFDTGNIGEKYQYAWGTSEVVAEHANGQPSAVIVRLSDEYRSWADAPIYYFSEGKLLRYAE